ncbi:MAG: hypothetical protein K6G17_06470 [Oscillospiraceae bacterium]|nr:hypothetical protein [Oscillospiraceae bacterium]
MTLDELNAHLYLVSQLNTAREMLQSMRDSVLHASNYDGMPHATGAGDKVASLAIKIDEQTQRVKLYEDQVKESEIHVKAWIDTIQDNRTNLIFYLRFICGYEWQAVAEVIGGRNTENSVKSLAYRFFHSKAL